MKGIVEPEIPRDQIRMSVPVNVGDRQASPHPRQVLESRLSGDLGKRIPIIPEYPDRHPVTSYDQVGSAVPIDVCPDRRIDHADALQGGTDGGCNIDELPVVVPKQVADRWSRIGAKRDPATDKKVLVTVAIHISRRDAFGRRPDKRRKCQAVLAEITFAVAEI